MPRAASQNVIHCANCRHCKVFSRESTDGHRERRVKCAKYHWRTDMGAGKTYSYHTLTHRRMRACGDYDSTYEPVDDGGDYEAGREAGINQCRAAIKKLHTDLGDI